MRPRTLLPPILLITALMTSFGGRRATQENCRLILDRLVDLELAERGFRDPALAARWRAEARATHAADLATCEGKRMPRAALACVQTATRSGEISDRCFR